MFRIIIAVLLIYAAVRLFKKVLKPLSRTQPEAPQLSGEMVSCAGCGTFILKGEAVRIGMNFFCSEKCRGT